MQEKNQAYDLNRFATEEFNALRVVENKEAANQKRRSTLQLAERIVVCAMVLGLTVSVLYTQTRITALSDQVSTLQTQLVEEKSVYDSLNYKLESEATLTKIEDYVSHQLGMVKTDKSQVTYLSLAEENKVEKTDEGLVRYWNAMKEKIESLLAYIRG